MNTRKPWLNEEQKTELERQMIEILCSYCGIEV
nr:MAG TPA: Nematode polyprotein allergen ABA-1 [Caudoviricetes sp.]